MNTIYQGTKYSYIKSYINRGVFSFRGTLYAMGVDTQGNKLIFDKTKDSKRPVLTVYPEEDLYKTVLKYIGFDLSMLDDDTIKENTDKKEEKKEKEDIGKLKMGMYSSFEKYKVLKGDILSYLRKSDFSVNIKDIEKMSKIYKKLQEGESPRKHFPISNRSAKNCFFHLPTERTIEGPLKSYNIDDDILRERACRQHLSTTMVNKELAPLFLFFLLLMSIFHLVVLYVV